jgi:hypothetical protein
MSGGNAQVVCRTGVCNWPGTRRSYSQSICVDRNANAALDRRRRQRVRNEIQLTELSKEPGRRH